MPVLRKITIGVMGVLVMGGCATAFRAGAPAGKIDVIGHRGASAYAPENTLASFALAKEMGADWFELDSTLTRDGQVIVIHDDTLDRTTNGKGPVADMTLAQLKQLDAGAWKDPKFAGERLPTLAEALDLARKRRIGVYLEIKNSADDSALIERIMQKAGNQAPFSPRMKREVMAMIRASGSRNIELTHKVIELVRKRRMQRQVVIQSFSPIVCALALGEAPRMRIEMLALKDKDRPERWPMFLTWNGYLHPRGFNTNPDSLDEALFHQLHAEGRMVAVWTVDEEASMRQFANWGVDALITNTPDVCLRVLREMGKR
jgi:glycerophosphoryl diester phosphodiesterase